jgi:hypothetical protein
MTKGAVANYADVPVDKPRGDPPFGAEIGRMPVKRRTVQT